jgi:hypothetical protein
MKARGSPGAFSMIRTCTGMSITAMCRNFHAQSSHSHAGLAEGGHYFPAMSTPDNGDHDLDIAKVNQRASDIENKLPKLKKLFEQAKIMLGMVKDYWNGSYREIPYWAISAVSLALLYVLNPADVHAGRARWRRLPG